MPDGLGWVPGVVSGEAVFQPFPVEARLVLVRIEFLWR